MQSFDTVSSSIVSWSMETADAAGGTTPAIPLDRETLKTLMREVMREERGKEKPGESSGTHPSGVSLGNAPGEVEKLNVRVFGGEGTETEEVVSKDVGPKEVLSKVTSDGPGVEASVPPFLLSEGSVGGLCGHDGASP